jgi:hypothetical protein
MAFARRSGFRSMGIELNPGYCALAIAALTSRTDQPAGGHGRRRTGSSSTRPPTAAVTCRRRAQIRLDERSRQPSLTPGGVPPIVETARRRRRRPWIAALHEGFGARFGHQSRQGL